MSMKPVKVGRKSICVSYMADMRNDMPDVNKLSMVRMFFKLTNLRIKGSLAVRCGNARKSAGDQ